MLEEKCSMNSNDNYFKLLSYLPVHSLVIFIALL